MFIFSSNISYLVKFKIKIFIVSYLGTEFNFLNKQLMVAHKPARLDERMRIEQAGGCVLNFGGWRVNGQLAVSRAIGV